MNETIIPEEGRGNLAGPDLENFNPTFSYGETVHGEPKSVIDLKRVAEIVRGENSGFRKEVEDAFNELRGLHSHVKAKEQWAVERKEALKEALMWFTGCGEFDRRTQDGCRKPSWLVQQDIDCVHGADAQMILGLVRNHDEVPLSFLSPSGGVKLLVCARHGDERSGFRAWFATRKWLEMEVLPEGVTVDPSTKDYNRICYFSWDPTCMAKDYAVPVDLERYDEGWEDAYGGRDSTAAPRRERKIDEGDGTPYALAVLRRSCDRIRTAEQKHNAIYAASAAVGNFVGGGELNQDFAEAELRAAIQTREHEMGNVPAAYSTMRDGLKKGMKTPKGTPPERPPWHGGWGGPLGGDEDVAECGPRRKPHWWRDERLEDRFGSPCIEKPNAKGQVVFRGIREPYWAGLHTREHSTLWEPDERQFYRYDDATGLHLPISADQVKLEISELLREAGRDKHEINECGTDAKLHAVQNHLRGQAEVRRAFDRTGSRVVHLANGLLHIGPDGGRELRPFTKDFRSRNMSPIAYDPAAKCPRFLEELLLPAVRTADAALVQKYAGMSLLGHNMVQRILILDGEAGRGKTQLANALHELIGTPNVTQLRTEFLDQRFEMYRYLKKTLLVGVDVQADFLNTKGAGVLKGIVGGDLFDAEQKGGIGSFQLSGNFCVLITSNSRLRVRLEGDVGAWRRRLMIVRYEAPPPRKKIPDFGKLLVAQEGPGILNWALDGLTALLADIENAGDIQMDEQQRGVVDSLLAESESLRHFLADRVAKAPGHDLTVAEIVESYADFCPARGWNPLPITVVHKQLEHLMLEMFGVAKAHSVQRDGRANKGFRGVGFASRDDCPSACESDCGNALPDADCASGVQ